MDKDMIDELQQIQSNISNMNKINQLRVLEILMKNKTEMNENKYGVHVNLSNCDLDTINQLKEFVTTTTKQDELLHNIEDKKKDVRDRYFTTQTLSA